MSYNTKFKISCDSSPPSYNIKIIDDTIEQQNLDHDFTYTIQELAKNLFDTYKEYKYIEIVIGCFCVNFKNNKEIVKLSNRGYLYRFCSGINQDNFMEDLNYELFRFKKLMSFI